MGNPSESDTAKVGGNGAAPVDGDGEQFITVTIADQLFGIPASVVHDVLAPQQLTPIPLAPKEVAGSLNLRGRIVTVINVRLGLGLEAREQSDSMYVAVEHKGELYSLMIDSVGEVLTLPMDSFERNPVTLDPRWREVSGGIYRLDNQLLVVLDVGVLLGFSVRTAA